jgi:hypothetical protein
MPGCAFSRLAGAAAVAAALGLGPSGPAAQACGRDCGYGFAPGPVYSAPPVYTYSIVPDGPLRRAYAPVYYRAPFYYTTRVEIFRGPRWGYAAAYYNPIRHGCCRRRAYLVGPIIPVSGPRWRRW